MKNTDLNSQTPDQLAVSKSEIKKEIKELQRWLNILAQGVIQYVPISFKGNIYNIDRKLINTKKVTGGMITNVQRQLHRKKKTLAIINVMIRQYEKQYNYGFNPANSIENKSF